MARRRGSGSIYKQQNSSVWWVKYYRNGTAYRESTKTADKDEAKQFLNKRLGEIATGTFYGPVFERITVAELADEFLRDYRINAKKSLEDAEARWELHLKPFFGCLRAANVSSDLIARYVDERQKATAANATVNRELAALKRMFHLGMKSTPPKVNRLPAFPRLQENNVRKGFLEEGQFEKLIAYCPELWFRTLVELGRTYGWRVSELLNLRVQNVDLQSHTVRLEPGTTKNREGREVFLTKTAEVLLTACVHGKSPTDPVFTREDGSQVKVFRKVWIAARKSAGVPNLLFHDLRRTAARNLRRAGVAEGVIMKIGGWKTRSVFERYAIVSQSDICEAIAKLENQNSGHSVGHSPTQNDKQESSNSIN